MSDPTLLIEAHDRVRLVTFNRPKALNALNSAVARDLADAMAGFDTDPEVGCVVLTGSERAFAAGADIKEMADLTYPSTYLDDLFGLWDRFAARRKPVVAAVSGFALGGGCEVVMMCDIVLAAETAKFGQPEIKLGVMPGMGGTQRLTRAVGKAKAMEMCLTGRMMDATEAERAGLVSRIVPAADLLNEALALAATIAAMPLPAVMMTKETIDRASELALTEGVRFERRVFHSMFATHDQKEGMAAFNEKRPATFEHR